jgi:hypothetical protein
MARPADLRQPAVGLQQGTGLGQFSLHRFSFFSNQLSAVSNQ